MLLKFCDDNFLFYITNARYFDILCIFTILFFIALFILVQKNNFFEKLQNSKIKKLLLVFSFGLFVGFLVFLFIWLLNKDSFNGCSTKYISNVYAKTKSNMFKAIDNLKNSKIIVVGDSRMEFIDNDKEIIKPFNLEFVAKSGMRIDWLKKTAIPQVKKILKNKDYKYYIVVNMGVNDLNSDLKGKEIAEDYFEVYSKLANEYSDAKIYLMSVNPIIENKLNKIEPENRRTNKKIKLFNKTIQKELKDGDTGNMYYCDAYSDLKFETDDGLHYTQNTNKKIINYIINDCVEF